MQIVRKDADALNTTLEITLEPKDFSTKLDSEIKKYTSKVQIKGFRKGKTPASVIKKMYGKSILSDVINETLQDALFGYIDDNDIKYLGQPLPHREENLVLNLDVNNLQEYKFSFDIGLSPKFEIAGISADDHYTLYDIIIDDKLVDDEVMAMQRRMGKNEDVEGDIQMNDILYLEAEEMQDGKVKDDGFKTNFNVLVELVHDKDIQKQFLGSKAGDSIVADVYKLENKDRDYIDKYLLKKPTDVEAGDDYELTITKVSRNVPAELNEDLFNLTGEEDVKDEASFRAFIRKDLKAFFDQQAKQYMNREIMDALMDNTEVPLPESFLKRYLKETNESVTDDVLSKEFDIFAKNMKWTLIKSDIARRFEIVVDENDIRRQLEMSVLSYMRNYGINDYSIIAGTVDKLMEDKERVNAAYEEVLADKIFVKIDEVVAKDSKSISREDFEAKVKEMNERVNNL
ncbi:MAG: trigger factor [Saprospiraceae bacterium]|nr:MAG: trigger factor [Bacteroidetes bacterium OLB9]MCO6464211.1 trigger factor [Saprospiraceae bacterium]MCZ2339896.1 trigger factor [Chitinophagales bacterium]